LELHGCDHSEIHNGLLRLLRLLIENISELVVDETWIAGQLTALRSIIDCPTSLNVIHDAECFLKEVISRQKVVKNSMRQAQSTLKLLITKFIDRLSEFSKDTGNYQSKLEAYSNRIGATTSVDELNRILDDLLHDTRAMHATTTSSRGDI